MFVTGKITKLITIMGIVFSALFQSCLHTLYVVVALEWGNALA